MSRPPVTATNTEERELEPHEQSFNKVIASTARRWHLQRSRAPNPKNTLLKLARGKHADVIEMATYGHDIESGDLGPRSPSPSPERPFLDHGDNEDEDDDAPSARRFIYDDGKYSFIIKWMNGPVPPEVLRIKPLFKDLQAAPLRLFEKLFPKKEWKIGVWLVACVVWLALFIVIEHFSNFLGEEARILSCGESLW